MKLLKSFADFLNEGIVKKQAPDYSRANSLIKESEKSYSFLMKIIREIGLNDENANQIVKIAYDIIMELIRAKMLFGGFSSHGTGAHEAEVAYLRELKFSETDIQFANQLRYFRNGIIYYGKKFDKEYAKKTLSFLNKVRLALIIKHQKPL